MTAFAAAIAASQALAPLTVKLQLLYAVALKPLAQPVAPVAHSLVKTPALRYIAARIALATDFVTRPYPSAGRVAGRSASDALSSVSMKLKTSARVERATRLSSVVVTSGTPPNSFIRT